MPFPYTARFVLMLLKDIHMGDKSIKRNTTMNTELVQWFL